MAAPKIRGDYDQLALIAKQFSTQAGDNQRAMQALRKAMQVLQGGDWVGNGASAFYAEMESQILPTLTRLIKALETAASTTTQIRALLHQAEQDAAAVLKDIAASAVKKGDGGGSWFSSALHQVGGFFEGVYEGGKGMVEGLWTMVTHPIQTVKGIGYAVTHPSELWDALKKPYVEDWNSGNQGRAIGRGAFEVVMLLVPGVGEAKAVTKGAEVASTAGRLAEISEAANIVSKGEKLAELGEAANIASKGEKIAELGEAARYIPNVSGAGYVEEASSIAIRKYEEIAGVTHDIPKIAENIGVKESVVEQVKQHLFQAEHEVPVGPGDLRVGKFTPDEYIADLWKGASEGKLTSGEAAEMQRLLAHEYTESRLMEQGLPYRSTDPALWRDGTAWPSSELFGAHDLAPLTDAMRPPFAHWEKLFPQLPQGLEFANDLSNLDEIVGHILNGVK